LVVIPPDSIFGEGGIDIETTFVGAILCKKWRVERFLAGGKTGRGWLVSDLRPTKGAVAEVGFVKTFRSLADQVADDAAGDRVRVRKKVLQEIAILLNPQVRLT
jgi:hypothetical protein